MTLNFPKCDNIGFYPIVDNISLLHQLLDKNVKTIQLRIKNQVNTDSLINEACQIVKEYQTRLFINDHWEKAIKYGAYGVHLGQEDLQTANLKEISRAKLRLGISIHNQEEAIKSAHIKPSYVAIGPIFKSPTKPKLKLFNQKLIPQIKELFNCPLVAIGGINLSNVSQIISNEINGIAVMSAINYYNLEQDVTQWLVQITSDELA